jgi:hypothetical protein
MKEWKLQWYDVHTMVDENPPTDLEVIETEHARTLS